MPANSVKTPSRVSNNHITSVTRAFSILELLASPDGPKALAEISRELALAPSTTHRFLKALTALGFVSQDPRTSVYRATLKLFTLGSGVLCQFNIAERLLPIMRRIAGQVGESVSLVLQEGVEGVLLDRVEGRQGVQVFAKYRRNPLYCTAAGKAILSCFDEESLLKYLKRTPFKSRTQYTLTDPADLKKEVERIRIEGFALDNQELEVGAMCVAVPLMLSEELKAAVSVSALAPRMTETRVREIAAVLSRTVADAGLGPPETTRGIVQRIANAEGYRK
jgi:DNA-binding IclR family transcriptional regulator